MLRFDIHGVFCDASAFIRRNKFKFLAAFLVVVIAFIFGAWNAVSITKSEELFLRIQKYNVVLLIAGERKFFSYFFSRVLLSLLLVLTFSLLGVKVFSSYLSYGVLALYVYQYAFFIGTLLCYAKLVVLPLVLLCLIPFFLVGLCVLIYYAVFVVCFACEAHIERFSDLLYYAYLIKFPLVIAASVCLVVGLLESMLACLLTIGIVL